MGIQDRLGSRAGVKALICFGICLPGLGLVGLLDWWTGDDVEVCIFYVLPIAAGLWFGGRWTGFALSVAAAVIWLVLEVSGGRDFSDRMVSRARVHGEIFQRRCSYSPRDAGGRGPRKGVHRSFERLV